MSLPPAFRSPAPTKPSVAPAFSASATGQSSAAAKPTSTPPAFRPSDLKSRALDFFQKTSEQAARTATKATGRPTTPGEVRTVALLAGGATAGLACLLALLVFAAMLESAATSSGNSGNGSSGGASAAGGEWDNSFESKMVRGFHEQGGSLNYSTEPNNP